MLNLKQATELLLKATPVVKVDAVVEHGDLYIFRAETDLPGEVGWDPFYSVNRRTRECRDYTILLPSPDVRAVVKKFEEGQYVRN